MMKPATNEKIIGKRIYLRQLTDKDASKEYCGWLNDPVVNKYLETRESTIEDIKKFIQNQVDNPDSFFVGIFDMENDMHIGNIKLEPIDWVEKSAVFGTLIGNKDYWGKGIGTEATNLISGFAFTRLALEKITLGVLAENKAAVRVYEKSGFEIIEVKEKDIEHDGVLFDNIKMELTRKKWEKIEAEQK
jgi:RimJ/RimL family protein N-acetyltransferase